MKMEPYQNKPIYYSLGNFIFDQKTEAGKKGLLAEISFSRKGLKYKSIPFIIDNCVPKPSIGIEENN